MLVHSQTTTNYCAYEIHSADTARYELYRITPNHYDIRLALKPLCENEDGLLVISRTFMAGNIPTIDAGVMQIASLVAGDEADLAAYREQWAEACRADDAAEARYEDSLIPPDPA